MTTPNTPGEAIHATSLPNLRDLGGWRTRSSGVVRPGMVYRSTGLDRLTPRDMEALSDLGIVSIFDLRTTAEAEARPDLVPPGASYVNLDVFADSSEAAVVHQFDLLTDPALAEEALGGGQVEQAFIQAYRDMVRLESARDSYRQLFLALSDTERLAGLFHCTTGKDRTGWAAAALLLLLGVAEEDVYREYLLTNEQLLPKLQPIFDDFEASGGDPDLLRPALGVQREYLQTSIDEMRSRYGTIENYFAEGLGLGPDDQAVLCEAFTVPADR